MQEGVQEFRSSGVQEFRSSGVQEFRSSGVQEFRGSGVQEFRSSGVQEFRSSGVFGAEKISSKVKRDSFRRSISNSNPSDPMLCNSTISFALRSSTPTLQYSNAPVLHSSRAT
jgi:hypothetical protein